MGMSTNIVGFHPPNEHWSKMRAVWLACEAAKIKIPDEVYAFFHYSPPDAAGVTIILDEKCGCTPWNNDHESEGFEVDIAKLPSGITKIRFYNSW